MQLRWRPYRWALQPPLITACGPWSERLGWLLRLEDPGSGSVGWGDAAPLQAENADCADALAALPSECSTEHLEQALRALPGPVAFAIGLALAELEGLHGGQWLPVLERQWPSTALLSVIGLPAAAQLIRLLREHHHQPERISGSKFLALRFQALSGLGLAIGLGIAPLLGR